MKQKLVAALLLPALAACGGSDDKSGRFSMAVTDAPVDNADAVVVTFTRVELLDDSGNAVLDVSLNSTAVDLLDLQGEQSQFLVQDAEIPAGVYQEIRLTVEAPSQNCQNPPDPLPSYITINGSDFPLTVPSGSSSGFKVKGPITIAAGAQTAFTVDFDLRKSIAERGNTGCYNLRPVLRAVDNAQVGHLAGRVDGALLADSSCTSDQVTGEGAAVYVFSGAGITPDDEDGTDPDPLTSALLQPVLDENDQPSGEFSYSVGFLLAGEYTAALTCNAADDVADVDDSASVGFLQQADVAITAEQTVQQDFSTAP